MVKTLRFSLFGLLILLCGSINAAVENVDFTTLEITKTDDGFTLESGNYAFTAVKNNGQTAPTQNGSSKDIRLYAKNTITVNSTNAMQKMVFTISKQGLKRQAEITPSVGTMTYDMDNSQVTWTADAPVAVVDFTVGDKAVYGSEGAGKAGQFDFNSVEITTDEGGAVVEAPAFSVPGGIYTTPQTVTLTAAAGCTIHYTIDGTTPTAESTVYTEPLNISENTTVKAVAADAKGTLSGVATETYTFPVVCADIAAVKQQETGTLVALTLTDAQVVYYNSYENNGNTNSDIFVRDASGAIDIYNIKIEAKAGSMLNGTLVCTYSPYNGMPELVSNEGTDAATVAVTEGSEPVAKKVTVADLNGETYMCDLVEISNVKLSEEVSGKYTNYYATDEDGVNKMMLYDKFKLGIEFPTADNTKTYTITGILGSAKLSGTEVKELFPTKAVEETVSGISSIEAENAQEAVYNLNGQRLAKPQKGLNIIGGKKVIVK